MSKIVGVFTAIGRSVRHLVSLVRDGQDDLDGTFPDRPKPTGEQVATQGSISIGGMGGSAH